MSVMAHSRTAKRRVLISRDGDDYVIKDRRVGVMMRGDDVNELRKVCRWLQWEVEDTVSASSVDLVSERSEK